MHSEQIEAEQQRGALTGAERHSEHPHQTRTASPGLREKGDKVRENIQLISLSYYGYDDEEWGGRSTLAEPYSGDGSFRRLDENGSLWVIFFLCRMPFSLAVTNNNKNNTC